MRFPTLSLWRFTVRYVEGPHQTKQDVWDVIVASIDKSLTHLEIKGRHLFVTVVGADTFTGPGGVGIGLYHSGIQHISIPGGGDAKSGEDREAFLREIAMSTAHEIVHYWQDINGTLEDSDECEDEAERIAAEIFGLEK